MSGQAITHKIVFNFLLTDLVFFFTEDLVSLVLVVFFVVDFLFFFGVFELLSLLVTLSLFFLADFSDASPTALGAGVYLFISSS